MRKKTQRRCPQVSHEGTWRPLSRAPAAPSPTERLAFAYIPRAPRPHGRAPHPAVRLQAYGNCVSLILGNRDVNKLRYTYEIDPQLWEEQPKETAVLSHPFHTSQVQDSSCEKGGKCDLVPHWTATGAKSYHNWLEAEGKKREPKKTFDGMRGEDSAELRLKWILAATMGAPDTCRAPCHP